MHSCALRPIAAGREWLLCGDEYDRIKFDNLTLLAQFYWPLILIDPCMAASPKTYQSPTGSTQFWAISKPAWVALIMRSISPNTEPVTSVHLFIGLTGASVLRCFRFVYSLLLSLLGLAQHVGFAKLKNLANQVSL
jgi:hypothetical protein